MDIAINNKSVAMVRRLESGAAFVGWLDQKAPKYILGSEWAKRWCVVVSTRDIVMSLVVDGAAPAKQWRLAVSSHPEIVITSFTDGLHPYGRMLLAAGSVVPKYIIGSQWGLQSVRIAVVHCHGDFPSKITILSMKGGASVGGPSWWQQGARCPSTSLDVIGPKSGARW